MVVDDNKKKRRMAISLILIICSFAIFTHQLKYSESAKVKKNLEDFRKVKTFSSSEVSQTDIDKIDKKGDDYSFTILDKEEIGSYKKLGKVFMADEKGDLVNTFDLYNYDEKYMIYMRNVHMRVD